VLLKDGRIDTTQGADIVCAATINLETATGNVVDVTGSTGPVTAVTLSQGHWRIVRFTGTPTLTNGASLVLPNAADYTVAAGDFILFIGYATGVVRAYIFPTSGPIPFVDSQPVVVGSADKTKKARFEVDGNTTATTRVLTVPDRNITLGAFTRAALAGFAMTNGTDAVNDINFAVGECRDSTNAADLIAATPLIKQLDAAWAAGTNAGGRMSAAAIANTTYHCYAIKKDTDGTIDFGFDTSATAPTMPAGYTYFRRIGSIVRAGATILAFIQDGDYFRLSIGILDKDTNTPGTTAVSVALSVPTGVNVHAFGDTTILAAAGSAQSWLISDLAATDHAPSSTANSLATLTVVASGQASGQFQCRTDTSAQVRTRNSTANADIVRIATLGWIDRRGVGA
jgi:hypothetical protein